MRDTGDGAADAKLLVAVKLHGAGRHAEAERLYKEIIDAHPANADAWHLLGVVAYQRRDFAAAVERIRTALAISDANPAFHSNLGLALHAGGQLAEAIRSYQRAVELQPDYPDAQYNLGNALQQAGERDEAVACYRRAVALKPDFIEAHNNLGNVLRHLGRLEQAAESYKAVLALQPGLAAAHNNLGNVLKALHRSDEAVASYRQALALRPDFAEAVSNLALALEESGRMDEALDFYSRAVSHDPSAANHANYAAALIGVGRIADAEEHLRRALAIEPGNVIALENMALVCTGRDCFDEAFGFFDEARSRAPDRVDIYRNLLPAILYHPRFDNARRFAEHRRFGAAAVRVARPLKGRFSNVPEGERRLRVGWLSSDFRDHPVGRNLEPFLHCRDREAFEAYCYSDVVRPDPVTERFRGLADHWRSVAGLSDREVAEAIRHDRIDILVIVAGRFDLNRATIAPYRAAPVQVSFLEAGSLAVPGLDYIVADAFMVPRGTTERFTERPLRLPNFYVYAPVPDAPPVSPPPGPAAGHATFGCFGNPSKINGDVVALWGAILRQVPGSRLLLKYHDRYGSAEVRDRLLTGFESGGISPGRVEIVGQPMSMAEHLDLYRRVDIVLDTSPFNGSTTTFEALWMGVPVVTLVGDHLMARWAGSMLAKVGLQEFLTATPERYVALAASLADRPADLARLRASLRARVAASALCDADRAAKHLQRALRAVWRRWCRRECPDIPATGRPGPSAG